ncbi:hypothetical protein BJAS_P3411 [Bathymodiolus japonicus methanotrophic gill symbiont]|uniref:hypothetical protein n=1 Tax=Bathymodiolus japonicus methanotrophic gill symbiont TaxID=113269 RepID=UPI001B424855|nr:hypothetical protein [Bathymodiolus japonicus methanotrophic gill symbiont]GFO72875.1 hypothetical protein BJAS_P3411 [Bathymodiolus japonicus methanotrophic gill symbiont]
MKIKCLTVLMGMFLALLSQVNYADSEHLDVQSLDLQRSDATSLDGIVRGTGAGGTITIMNNSGHDAYITWSGSGCAGAAWGLTVVCEKAKFTRYTPYQRQTYKYNWGVTRTWVNVATALDHSNKAIGDIHPCSAMSTIKDACVFDHKVVDTYADYETYCNYGIYQGKYYFDCDKVAN